MKNFLNAYRNIFNYKGEATLSEFWSVFAINFLLTTLVAIITAFWRKFDPAAADLSRLVLDAFRLVCLLEIVPLGFKRLKNAGLSGFLFFIPIINLGLAVLPEKKAAA